MGLPKDLEYEIPNMMLQGKCEHKKLHKVTVIPTGDYDYVEYKCPRCGKIVRVVQ